MSTLITSEYADFQIYTEKEDRIIILFSCFLLFYAVPMVY